MQAIRDRIVTQAGAPIEKGIVLIRDGIISAVGTSMAIPADAEIIDGSNLTINPARILGIDDRVGSLKVGKDADLFINGKNLNLSTWWDGLYENWNSRPIKK